MRVLLQRVTEASVSVDGQICSSIGLGLLLLVGFGSSDDSSKLQPMVEKLINLRIFSDNNQKFMYSLLDVKGSILAVPQFTLFADTSRGRRPEFISAMKPSLASPLFDLFIQTFRDLNINTGAGIFGAHMQVKILNDGPVTIMMEI